MLMLKGLISGLFQLVILAMLLLIPAGTWQWPRAIQFLTGYGILLFAATVFLAIFAPKSLAARLEPPMAKSQPMMDRIVTTVLIGFLSLWFMFIPVDFFI